MKIQNPKTGETYYLHIIRHKFADGSIKPVRLFFSKEPVVKMTYKDGTTEELKEEELPAGFVVKDRVSKTGKKLFPPVVAKQRTPEEEAKIKEMKEKRRIARKMRAQKARERKIYQIKKKKLLQAKAKKVAKLVAQLKSTRQQFNKKIKELEAKYKK